MREVTGIGERRHLDMKWRLFILGIALPLFAIPNLRAQDHLVFSPQWMAQAQFAGYYVAQELGFYREAGLEVEIVHPSLTQQAVTRVKNSQSQVMTMDLCQAMQFIANGTPLVNILQTSMNNSVTIVSRRGKDPLTQHGERLGLWPFGFNQMAICLNEKEKMNYDLVYFSSGINLFVSGAIDATLAMSYNEYYQIIEAGFSLSDENVYRFCDHGYNIQEDGVYMARDYYESHKDQAQRFAAASRRGWEWAAEHPDETHDIVMSYVRKYCIATNSVQQRLMLKEILRLQVDRESGRREFRLRPDMVEKASNLMFESKLIARPVTYEELIP